MNSLPLRPGHVCNSLDPLPPPSPEPFPTCRYRWYQATKGHTMTTAFRQADSSLHSVISLDALAIKLTDPRYNFKTKLASLDHAASCSAQDGDTGRLDAITAMRQAFIDSNPGGAASLN